jgi:hypothetical protein
MYVCIHITFYFSHSLVNVRLASSLVTPFEQSVADLPMREAVRYVYIYIYVCICMYIYIYIIM